MYKYFCKEKENIMQQKRYFPNLHRFVYTSPQITFIDTTINIITESPAYDPNEGEWDVEGEE